MSDLPEYVDVTGLAALVRGAVELETTGRGLRPHRLPAWARAQCDDEQLAFAQAQPSGIRLAMRTAATRLELDVVATKVVYVGSPPRPDGVFDLRVEGELVGRAHAPTGDVLTIDYLRGGVRTTEPGPVATLVFDLSADPVAAAGTAREVEVWLPHTESVVLVGLRADAPVRAAPDLRPTWVHHGSSISQGSNAASPSTTWPAVAARAAGLALTNLGYGGSALLDPFVARTIRDLPLAGPATGDRISLELGINLVNTDLMRRRALGPAVEGFLDTIREGHPDLPLTVISPIACPVHETTPGPTVVDIAAGTLMFSAAGDPAEVATGKLTLEVVRGELSRIVARRRAAGDLALAYVDGRDLYGPGDLATHPLPDGLHPDAATHELIGARWAAWLIAEPGLA